MATTQEQVNLILFGRTGVGKSASGNTILEIKKFVCKSGFQSVSQEIQMETIEYGEVTFNVYDTPGLFNPDKNNADVMSTWQNLPEFDQQTVFLVVIKADRVSPEDKTAVSLIKDFIPELLQQKMWILFTRGDELERENKTIEQFIKETKHLEEIVQMFHNQYHVFNNLSQKSNQVQSLLKKIKDQLLTTPGTEPSDWENHHLQRRIVLLGKTGVGKSATGNTILGDRKFESDLTSSSVLTQCELQESVVSGKKLSVIETPGIFHTTKSIKELAVELERSIHLSSPGPHAFLYILPANTRYTEQEESVIKELTVIFGEEMLKYTIFLFTYGDQLEGKDMDTLIQNNTSLKQLIDQCGGGYHIFNNKLQINNRQVTELLNKIDRVLEQNAGCCYLMKMVKQPARLKDRSKRFKEFLKKYKKVLIAVGLVAVPGCAVAGAIAGAAIGACVSAGVGAAFGVVGTAIYYTGFYKPDEKYQ